MKPTHQQHIQKCVIWKTQLVGLQPIYVTQYGILCMASFQMFKSVNERVMTLQPWFQQYYRASLQIMFLGICKTTIYLVISDREDIKISTSIDHYDILFQKKSVNSYKIFAVKFLIDLIDGKSWYSLHLYLKTDSKHNVHFQIIKFWNQLQVEYFK